MRVLVACEFSGVVTRSFRKRGHEAFSCDLIECEDAGMSLYHYQQDVLSGVLRDGWDLMIAHPPCTYLTCSAEWAYSDGPYHQQVKPDTLVGTARRKAREEAIQFVQLLMNAPIKRIAIENPIGVLSSRIRKPEQIIQPYQFGEDASKATCLWLQGLPVLKETNYVEPRIVDGKKRWSNQTDSGQNRLSPSNDRWAKRSVTYQGIADAMAEQWGKGGA